MRKLVKSECERCAIDFSNIETFRFEAFMKWKFKVQHACSSSSS